jgi:hypothetical protein
MNKRFCFFAGLFLLCITAALPVGGQEKKDATVRVTGVVRLVGSANFSELVITTENGEWYVTASERDKLHDLQHRTVTVEGVETVREMKFANGRSAGNRRELRDIKIIDIQKS